MDFINKTNIKELNTTDDIMQEFYAFAKKQKGEKIGELISEEKLKSDAERFINNFIDKGTGEYAGDGLDAIMPPLTRIGGARTEKKQQILEKIRALAKVYVGI